jgi:3D (Asp-Asp-Asp) domain-containing protein
MRIQSVMFGLSVLFLVNGTPTQAAIIGDCQFDTNSLKFAGDDQTQARCLMRPVQIGGHLGAQASLPVTFAKLIGTNPTITRSQLKVHLEASDSPTIRQLAATLQLPISRARSNNANAPQARYFVVHDTSTPNFGQASQFPSDIDTSNHVNRLDRYPTGANALAHFFVNRLGEVQLFKDFSVPWRATALELKYVGTPSRGLFLHSELVQPRRNNANNIDLFAPTPGFMQTQYDRLATLYVVASVRAGKWMIPATHLGVTSPLPELHDDPQNFDFDRFDAAVASILALIPGSQLPSATPPLNVAVIQQPLRASLYYTALQSDYAAGADTEFLTRDGSIIAKVSGAFAAKAAIEGSAKLDDGRLINVDGVVSGVRRWKVVNSAFGLDAVGCSLVPMRSAAVDRTAVPLRTKLFLPETVGLALPSGGQHDGIWYAVDTGSAIQGDRIDLFVGAGLASMQIAYGHGISHLRPLAAERRGTLTGCVPG